MWQDGFKHFSKLVQWRQGADACRCQQLNAFKGDNWNKGLKALIDAGLKYSPTQLNLTLAEQEEYELIGINTSLRGNWSNASENADIQVGRPALQTTLGCDDRLVQSEIGQ